MQIVELAAKLQSIGLTDKQAKVYVAALFLGPSSAQKISQQAGVNRATTYVIVEELITMGILSQSSESGKTVFVAEPPSALDRHLTTMQDEIERQKAELKQLSGELDAVARSGGQAAPQVFFYKGKEGLEQVSKYYRKHVKAGSTLYSMTDNDEAFANQPKVASTSKDFRLKKKISVKTLFSADEHPLITSKKDLREAKRLPEKAKGEILIQDDFAIFETYRDGSFIALVVESRDIAQALRQLHELAWDNYHPKSDK